MKVCSLFLSTGPQTAPPRMVSDRKKPLAAGEATIIEDKEALPATGSGVVSSGDPLLSSSKASTGASSDSLHHCFTSAATPTSSVPPHSNLNPSPRLCHHPRRCCQVPVHILSGAGQVWALSWLDWSRAHWCKDGHAKRLSSCVAESGGVPDIATISITGRVIQQQNWLSSGIIQARVFPYYQIQ